MAFDMPAAEVDITPELVSSLLGEQRPEFAHLEVRELAHGWDNVSFRVGEDLVARLPRRAMAVPLVENEARWLPVLASRLPIEIPVPVFLGSPGLGYPWRWTLVPWIPGRSAALAPIDLPHVGRALADFLMALHTPAPGDAPVNPYRGVPLSERDESVRDWITRLAGTIDQERATFLWGKASRVPSLDGSHSWIHGDLHSHNLLVDDGRLTGVIDFGDICGGDPATDLAIAWTLFPASERRLFREAYGGDPALWERAKGWALLFSLAYLATSANNPTMQMIGAAGLDRVLDEDW